MEVTGQLPRSAVDQLGDCIRDHGLAAKHALQARLTRGRALGLPRHVELAELQYAAEEEEVKELLLIGAELPVDARRSRTSYRCRPWLGPTHGGSVTLRSGHSLRFLISKLVPRRCRHTMRSSLVRVRVVADSHRSALRPRGRPRGSHARLIVRCSAREFPVAMAMGPLRPVSRECTGGVLPAQIARAAQSWATSQMACRVELARRRGIVHPSGSIDTSHFSRPQT